MKCLLILIAATLCSSVCAQKVLNVRYPTALESIELTKGVSVPTLTAGYTLWLPKKGPTKGLIVFAEERRDSVEQTSLIKYALRSKLAVIYVVTDNPVEFLFQEKKIKELADNLLRVSASFNIPPENLLYTGNSLGGTRALKLAIFCMQDKTYERIRPRAIAICDAPLDISRYYQYHASRTGNYSSADEPEYKFSMTDYLSKNLDGTPTDSKARYASYSPYSRYVRNGGNAGYLTKTYVRGYVNAEVNWTNEKLGGNSFDVANFIDQLALLGSTKAEMIVVSPKRKVTTSWNMVDQKELVEWFVSLLHN